MNERINELVLTARQQATSDTKDGKCFDLDLFHRNFAELIVADCISKMAWGPKSSGPEGLSEYNQGWVNGRALAVEHIKEHFGVK